MQSAMLEPQSAEWLSENGLKQLELLLRAIVYQPAEPILIADNERRYRDASCGAIKLLGLARDKIVGRRIDDFAEPGFKPQIEQSPQEFPFRDLELCRHPTGLLESELFRYTPWKYTGIDKIPPYTIRALVKWPWPGNVRELENFIERSIILSPGSTLRAPLAELRNDAVQPGSGTLAEMERGYIIRVLPRDQWRWKRGGDSARLGTYYVERHDPEAWNLTGRLRVNRIRVPAAAAFTSNGYDYSYGNPRRNTDSLRSGLGRCECRCRRSK